MFDLGRILVFGWALFRVVRARAWLAAFALVIAAYFFALGVASGFAVRSEGPMSPFLAVVLGLIGPSSLPRGKLPPLPFKTLALEAPIVVDALTCLVLVLVARRMDAKVVRLPQFSDATYRLSRAALAVVLAAVFAGLSAALRAIPAFLDWGAG